MFLEKPTLHDLPPLPTTSTTRDKHLPTAHLPRRLMAHDLIMPVPQFTSSTTQYTPSNPAQPQPRPAQPLSPVHSATATPHNASPTSPRTTHPPPLSAAHTQLRPPKSPLYIPAVLRPTDPPKRVQKPPTPPQSMHSSFENLENAAKGLSRRSTAESGKLGLGLGDIIEGECSLEGLGKVTGMPTREHWKPDSSTPICDDPTCTRSFTYLTRRHHCRRCGNIFCDTHSPYSIPLDQDANYHPAGARCRACQHCWMNFRRWVGARTSRSNSEDGEVAGEEERTPTLTCKGKARGGAIAGIFGGGKNNEGGVSASVPRDWNWSTF